MRISDDLLQYCLEDGFRGNTIRSSMSDMILSMAKEIKYYRDKERLKEEWPDKIHESRKLVRSSGVSTFDFIWDDCDATDDITGSCGTIQKPCKGTK